MSLSRRAFFATLGAAFGGFLAALTGTKIGDTLDVRKPMRFHCEDGPRYNIDPGWRLHKQYRTGKMSNRITFHDTAFVLETPRLGFPNHAVFPRKPAAFDTVIINGSPETSSG